MPKRFLTLLLLFGACTATSAQTSTGQSSLASAIAAATPVTSADTVQAVHRLFEKHRTGGWIWTGIGAAFAARIATVAATSNSDAASGTAAGTAVGIGVFGGIPAGIGVGKLVRFSAGREAEIVTAYEQTKRLPPAIQRRLKRKYFKR